MPTNRRKRQPGRRATAYDTPRTRERLRGGGDWSFFDGAELTQEQLWHAWQQMGDSITADYQAQHPGAFPWAHYSITLGVAPPPDVVERYGLWPSDTSTAESEMGKHPDDREPPYRPSNPD